MARYTYNKTLVKDAIEELNNAIKQIEDVSLEIQKGIDLIQSAKGSQYINLEEAPLLLQYEGIADTVISGDIKLIKEKSSEIEDYENAGFFKKVFATAGMGLTKLGEGMATGIEDLIDGGATLVGAVGGIFSSKFKDSVSEFIEKDHVEDAFYKAYDTGWLKNVDKYSVMSHQSTAANVFKGFGNALPYVALSMTGVGIAAETGIAALGGIGSGTSEGLENGKSFYSAFGSGLWEGTKNAALVYAMGKLSNGIRADAASKTGKIIKNTADDFTKLAGNNLDDAAKTAKKLFGTKSDIVAKNVKGQVKLYNAKNNKLMGTVITDGKKVVLSRTGSKVSTQVMKKSGKTLVLDGVKATDDIINTSFSKLVRTNVPTTSEKVFQKAGKFKDTKPGEWVTKVDDVLTGSPIGKATSTVAKKGTNLVKGAISKSPKVIQKLANSTVKLVTNHKVGAYTAAAAVFTADKVKDASEEVQSRNIQNPQVEQRVIDPVPTPDPIITENPTDIDIDTNTDTDNGGNTTPTYNPSSTDTTPNYSPDTGINNDNGNNDSGTSNNNNDNNTNNNSNNNDNNSTNNNTNYNNNNNDNNSNYTPENNSGINSSNHAASTYSDVNGGYSSYQDMLNEETTEPLVDTSTVLGETDDLSNSFADLVTGNSYTNIPTSSTPITTTTTTSSGKNSVIPVIAGLGAAAVAGIGTKAYLDKKENKDEEDIDEVTAEEWSGEDTFDMEYEEIDGNDYLSPTDEYAYQEDSEESYEAVNSSELASMQ